MRSANRLRVIFASLSLAAITVLSLVSTALADGFPGPFPK